MWTVLRVLESVNSPERAGGIFPLRPPLFKIKVRKGE